MLFYIIIADIFEKFSKMKSVYAKYKDVVSSRNILVDFLAMIFGLGSWIGVNAVYLQLPLLVSVAPEGWNLPSYLVIVIQTGNIGPLIYTVVQKYSPKKFNDEYLIYGLFLIGCLAAIFMAFFYQYTAFVAGQERSVALLVIAFFFAFVGCTSSVLFMPFMGRFKEIYLVTYLVGEGLSGFLPSIVTLIQGIGGNPQCIPNNDPSGPEFDYYTPPPRFETPTFFLFIFFMLCLSATAFLLINKLKICKKEYVQGTVHYGNNYRYRVSSEIKKSEIIEKTEDEVVEPTVENKHLSMVNAVYLMFIMAIVSLFGSGVFPGIQSFSCLPYGNVVYHLTVTLSSIANPLACFLAVFVNHTSIPRITWLSLVTAGISAYGLATAIVQPLLGTTIGEILVVRK